MINVLIVENSLAMRMQQQQVLESDPGIRVVGMVESGEAALRFLKKNSHLVDVVTMDIIIPGMDGFTAARRIMETTPLPIVIVSAAYKPNEAENSFKAMEAGAVAIIEKPMAAAYPDYPRISRELVETVKLMSEVKVVTRWNRKKGPCPPPAPMSTPHPPPVEPVPGRYELVVIGSSTGGPPVLRDILCGLPREFPLPVLIVQHISPGFIEGLARWLESETGFPVRLPGFGEICQPGQVYLAPDDYHLGIFTGNRIILEKSALENGHRPSVSYLFRSAVQYYPKSTIGVLLTGMGSDGAVELKVLKESGSLTFAQDEESCVVFGMPGEAVNLGAADFVLPPNKIAREIVNRTSRA